MGAGEHRAHSDLVQCLASADSHQQPPSESRAQLQPIKGRRRVLHAQHYEREERERRERGERERERGREGGRERETAVAGSCSWATDASAEGLPALSALSLTNHTAWRAPEHKLEASSFEGNESIFRMDKNFTTRT